MKKLISILLAVIMIAGLAIGIQASAVKNLLPVTEETKAPEGNAYVPGMDNDGTVFGSWTDLSGGDISKVISIDKTVKKVGTASIKMVNAKLGHSTCIFLVTGLKQNTTYTLQAWVKTDKVMSATDWGCSISAEFYNFPNIKKVFENKEDQGKYLLPNIDFDSDHFSGTKDWRRISLSFKTPAKTFTHVTLQFKLWDGAGTAWYDGLALTEGKAVVDDSKLQNPGSSTPTKTPTPAPDVPSSWAKAEVTEAINAKLVPSALQSKYVSSITRSDFCDLVVNMIQVKSGKTIAEFVKTATGKDLTDKPFPDTMSANVNAASKLGIVNGRTNGNFDPNGLITRQEAAKMLALTAKALGQDITATAAKFADDAKIATWAKDYVNFVFAKGVMAGTGNNNFSPAANYTREQSFLTILRLFKALK